MQTVIEEIRRFVSDNFLFGQSSTEISDDDSFLEKGIIDSTGVLQLVGFIQETFTLMLDDEELLPENLDSIRRVASFVRRKLAAAEADALSSEALHPGKAHLVASN